MKRIGGSLETKSELGYVMRAFLVKKVLKVSYIVSNYCVKVLKFFSLSVPKVRLGLRVTSQG